MRCLPLWVMLCATALVPLTASADEIDPLFKAYSPETPGCAVGVARPGQPAILRGYGTADLEHGVRITPDTIFEAGSISKQFTATAVLMLAEDGKLALTDDIRKYLPEMPDYGTPITINHLLSHTSGLRDWGHVAALGGWPRTAIVRNNLDVLHIVARQRALNYAPGSAYSYTNTGFNLAAIIAERVSGKSLPAFTRERIFTPLGMRKSSWRDDFRRVVQDRAIAYTGKDDDRDDPYSAAQTAEDSGAFRQDMPFEDNYGHGGLLTTVGDLLTWDAALTARKLGAFVTDHLEEQAVLTGGRKIAYARGLVRGNYNGVLEISHGGATSSYRAWTGRYPSLGVAVAVLCNVASANATRLGRDAVAQVMNLKQPPPVKSSVPTAGELAQLSGLYIDERTGGAVRIVARDGALKLMGAAPEKEKVTALPRLGDRRYRNGVAELIFTDSGAENRSADGEVTSYRKIEAYTPTAKELESLVGRYSSAEANGVFAFSVKDGRPRLTPVDRPSAPVILTPLGRDIYLYGEGLTKVVRSRENKVEGLRFIGARVYSLVFSRAPD